MRDQLIFSLVKFFLHAPVLLLNNLSFSFVLHFWKKEFHEDDPNYFQLVTRVQLKFSWHSSLQEFLSNLEIWGYQNAKGQIPKTWGYKNSWFIASIYCSNFLHRMKLHSIHTFVKWFLFVVDSIPWLITVVVNDEHINYNIWK